MPRRRLTGWLRSFGWPLVCLFQLGLIAGALYYGSRLAAPSPPQAVKPAGTGAGGDEPPHAAAPEQEPLPPLPPRAPQPRRAARGELEEVDRLIRVGRHETALELCRSFTDRAAPELRDAFAYRLGLCLEGLGHADEALTTYRKLASHTPSPSMGAMALLGQARVWLRLRRPAEGKALLCDLIRRSALPGLRGRPFLADAHYLLALTSALEILPNEPPGPFNDNPVIPLGSDWSLERALDWDGERSRVSAPSVSPGISSERLRDSARPEEIIEVRAGTVRVVVHQMPLTGLLDRLAEQAKLRLEWSPRARQVAEGRGAVVALEGASLPDALRVLVEPMGLVWVLQGERLNLYGDEEASAEQLRALRWGGARRALREAVQADPRHPLTPAAYLELGDLEATAGHLDVARDWYARLARDWPRSPLAIEANYNLGLLRIRQGDRAAARQAFYHVVDRAPAHELAPLAYWRIGRVYLEEGDAEQALSPLRRGLRVGGGSPASAAAAVTLAAAHLLADNPRAANAILVEHRDLVAQERYRGPAAFLDTLARFRSATDRRRRQREAGDLLAALLNQPDEGLLGPCGLVLMGQAYRELGMPEEMARVYQKALPGLHGALADEVSLALAEALWNADKRDAALRLYGRLAGGEPSAATRRARLRLAEIALTDKKPQDCLKACRALAQEKDAADVPAVLRLMAGAYEQLGERDKAIRCLSGELPP